MFPLFALCEFGLRSMALDVKLVLLAATVLACVLPLKVFASSERCRVVTVVTADDIRQRPTYVAILVPSLRPTLKLSPNDNNGATKSQLIDTFSSSQGLLQLSDVSTYVEDGVSTFELGITFVQLTTYRTFSNDNVSLSIPASFFNASDSSSSCAVSFPVLPSAGTIGIDNIVSTIFEVDINTGNTTMTIVLINDEFSTSVTPMISPVPLPLGLSPILISRLNASSLRFVLLQNETLNIDSNSNTTYSIVITFQPNCTRTGISPEVGPLAKNYLELTLSASVPSVRVSYPSLYGEGTASVPSEALWDGVAQVYLDIQGDEWLPNNALWTLPSYRPTFAAAPFQDSGFDFLVSVSTLLVTISGRRATLTWSSCFGFAVASKQTVSVSDWNRLTSEGLGDIVFTFAIRPATASAVSVVFTSGPNLVRVLPNETNTTDVLVTSVRRENCSSTVCTNVTRYKIVCSLNGALPWVCKDVNVTAGDLRCNATSHYDAAKCPGNWTNTTMKGNFTTTTNNITAYGSTTEFVLRKTGIVINVSLSHDTVSPALDASALQEAFSRNSALTLDLTSSLVFTKYNSTYFGITLSPDLSYNIDSGVVAMIAITPLLLSSGGDILNNVLQLTISAVPTPVCSYPSTSPIISSEAIRQGRTSVEVLVINDTICDRSAILITVVPFITTTRGVLNVTANSTDNNATRMIFSIAQLTSYTISSFDQVYLPMTASPFCSLEACQAFPLVDSDYPNRVTVSVRPSAGVLQLHLPTVNEIVMRTTPITANIVIRGDVFSQVGLTFYPTFSITGSSLDTSRGFAATIQKSCAINVDSTNASVATMSCAANSTYDISANETVSVTIPRTVMASLESPSTTASSYSSLIVTPVRGTVTATIGTSTVLNESTIIAGGYQVSFTLMYERWTAASTIASALRANYPSITSNDSAYTTVGFLSTFMATSTFTVLSGEGTLVATLPALPGYDIISNESFYLLFDGLCVVSGIVPSSNNYTFIVVPSAGYITANGSALLFGVRDMLTTRLTVWLRLHSDLWNTTATFITSELCPMTQCTVVVDSTRRVLQIFFEPNPDYYIPVDTMYPIVLRAAYVVSHAIPLNPGSQQFVAYITPGILSWAGPASVTSETVIRAGSTPQIFITISGDLFTTPNDVYASIVRATTCSLAGSSTTTSFCDRMPRLMQASLIVISDGNRVAQITLQADGSFDAAQPEVVVLALDGRATQSRVAPTINYSFTIIPSAGTFSCSGLPDALAAVDFAGGPTSRPLRMRITLTGDRFLHNVSLVIQALCATGVSVSGGPGAFSIYQGLSALLTSLITPQSSTLSDDDKTLTINFIPNSDYLSDNNEQVNLTIPGAALVSGITALTTDGAPFQFSILATSAEVSVSPLTIYASELRTTGANVFLTIASGGTWEQSYVQVGSNIFASALCGSTLREEPYGCSRYMSSLFSQVIGQGALINGSALVIQLEPVPSYDIVFPETITFELTPLWTAAELPPVPSQLTFTIAPDPLIVYAVIALQLLKPSTSSVNNSTDWDAETVAAFTPTLVDPPSFRTALSEWLSIPMSLIEVVSNQPERRIGNVSSTMFLATIGFMIRNVQTSSPYYDESLATDFLSMARATPLTSSKQPLLSWKHFRSDAPVGYAVVVSSVYYAFSSAQAPPDYIWAYLESGILPSDNSFTFPLTPLAIFGIVAGAAAAAILVVAIRRTIVRSRTQGGLGRASHRKNDNSTGNVTADAYEDSQRAEEQHREDAALFSGQRGMDHTLSGGPGDGSKVSRQWRGDPRRATVALNKETINRDVPILLYSGQQSQSPVRSEEVRLDIDAFLEENGYKPQQQSSDGNDGPKRHVHRVTAVEARLQRAAVAAGLASSAGKEGDMVAAVDPLDDPFQHVVYPVWSQNRPGAFRPPSKFKDDTYRDL